MRKAIEGFPQYEVSDKGEVRTYKHGKYRTIKPQLNYAGYQRVGLQKDGKSYKRRVNRLVALAFIENPDGCSQVNHKDFSRTNNCVENLERATRRQNTDYSRDRQAAAMKKMWEEPGYKEKMSIIRKANLTKIHKDPVYKKTMQDMHKSESYKKTIKEAQKKRRKPVSQYTLSGELITSFDSSKDAAISIGISYTTGIQDCCRGKLKHHKGFKRRYK